MELEKRRFFVYMAASVDHAMSTEVENGVFRHSRIFRNNTCIINQFWQSSKITIFFCKYYKFSSDILISSSKCFSCSSLQCYQSFPRNQEGKLELQKKVYRRIMICRFNFFMAEVSVITETVHWTAEQIIRKIYTEQSGLLFRKVNI